MFVELRAMFREFRGHDGTSHGYATIDMIFVDEFDAFLRSKYITL